MSRTENVKKAQRAAASPEARAKAAATNRRRHAEKKALLAAVQDDPLLAGQERMSLDAIPDKEPKRMGRPKKVVHAGHWISDADYMILKMAKMMLKNEEGK